MSAPMSHVSKAKVAVPVMYLFGSAAFFMLAIFLVSARPSMIFGALITFVSCILWIIARVQLGDAPAEGRLVTSGLYSELRHPIYYFSTAALLGVAVFMWISELFIAAMLLAAFQFVRIQYEEQALVKKLGRRYKRYQQRTRL